jgi:FAD:protein FMN transferase
MPTPRRPFSLRGAAPRWWVLLTLLLGASVYLYLGRSADVARGTSRFEGRTMGTLYRVVLGQPRSGPELGELQGAVEQRLEQVNASMSTFHPESELSRFNRHLSTEPFEVSPELAGVIHMALAVSQASDGAFDITVGPLVEGWGFGSTGRPKRALDEEELSELRQRVGYTKLRVEGTMLVKAHPDLRVDLSAIAKGHAVDEVAALLEARGVLDYLVEIGGEVRVRGRKADGRKFRVGIEEPDPGQQAVRLVIELDEGALATSGNYRNFYELDGRRYVHTIDPPTGRPVSSALLSASVLHDRCAMADAWATALMVAGPDRAWQLAQAAGLEVLLLVAAEKGRVKERATPGFSARRVSRVSRVSKEQKQGTDERTR